MNIHSAKKKKYKNKSSEEPVLCQKFAANQTEYTKVWLQIKSIAEPQDCTPRLHFFYDTHSSLNSSKAR